jgi:hypothetical protein
MPEPTNQAEALARIQRGNDEKWQAEFQRLKVILEWADLPIGKQIREELKKQATEFEKTILTAGNKITYDQYLGAVYALKRTKLFEDVIDNYRKTYENLKNQLTKQGG